MFCFRQFFRQPDLHKIEFEFGGRSVSFHSTTDGCVYRRTFIRWPLDGIAAYYPQALATFLCLQQIFAAYLFPVTNYESFCLLLRHERNIEQQMALFSNVRSFSSRQMPLRFIIHSLSLLFFICSNFCCLRLLITDLPLGCCSRCSPRCRFRSVAAI